jgi:hypothetical protein
MNLNTEPQQAFHRGTAPIFALLSDDQIRRLAQLQADSSLADQVDELAAKANEGELTDEERDVYEAYIEANNLMAILQAEARFRLQPTGV